jgi:hypothetical protein
MAAGHHLGVAAGPGQVVRFLDPRDGERYRLLAGEAAGGLPAERGAEGEGAGVRLQGLRIGCQVP